MKWITAGDLERWSDTIDSRTRLSELVSNLIRGSATKITAFRFPTGDSAQLQGYDGRLVAEEVAPYVPGGESVWEFGTSANPLAKANSDYEERTKNPRGVDPAQTTFVFVTSRRWSGKEIPIEEWCNERISPKGPWKDVRIIDAVALEEWLVQTPPVAAHAARQILGLVPQDGVRSALEYWQEYASGFEPELTEEVVLCGRERQTQDLTQQLQNGRGIYLWQADSSDEAVAFVVASVRKAPDDLRKFFESKMTIVDSISAARALAVKKNMVFIARGEAEKLAGQLAKGNVCILGIGDERRHAEATRLARPLTHDLTTALRTMGPDENKASHLARMCGRSVTILGRRIGSPTAPKPGWAGEDALVPALLAGSWDASVEHDRDIVKRLAGACQ